MNRKYLMLNVQRYILFKKLSTQSIEQFRDLNINDYDLNMTETFEEI